ncbi:hypothetical protein ABBQ32_004183 [Trebouxia sp. C0010 RCD-2024]
MSDREDHLLSPDLPDARGVTNPFQGINLDSFDAGATLFADNFHTLSSQFPQLNQSLGSFSQQSLHALGQQALGQQALHQRSVSLPQRLSPQTGLYDTNPNSLLHALRAHGQPKAALSLAQQHQQQEHEQPQHQPQPLHAAAASHRRLQALQHELPDRETSDNSPSGPSRQHPAGPAEARLTGPAAALPSSPAANSLHQSASELLRMQHTFSHITLEELRATTEKFALEREWEKFHSPRNLLLALVGEVGELSEIFQWRGDSVAHGLLGFSNDDKQHVGEEMSDVLLYLIRMADVCGIDLANAVQRKIQMNAEKYPAEVCRGSSAKYTSYNRGSELAEDQNNKRKRFSDEQLSALTDLADEANWSLLSVAKEVREQFCSKHEISKERLHNFFNNRKPKDLKKRKLGLPGSSDMIKTEPSLDLDQQQQAVLHQQQTAPAPNELSLQ